MRIMAEAPDQASAIGEVVAEAFGGNSEARLVEALRRDGDLVLSLVAMRDDMVCGHVALSRLKSPPGAVALAPLSVRRGCQGQGIGSALVRHAIAESRAIGCTTIFVVGAPAFYERFGFSQEAAAPYPCQYAWPHFMALPLGEAGSGPAAVAYADAFAGLD